MLIIKCKKFHPEAKLPTKTHDSDLGWDLSCVADAEFVDNGHQGYLSFTLQPSCSHLFRTGLGIQLWDRGGMDGRYEKKMDDLGFIPFDRSGLGVKNCIHRLAGVVDANFVGEILVRLVNLGKDPYIINTGDRIAQAVIVDVYRARAEWGNFQETDRGEKGFGSSGD